jgi:pimeloyl-ACP methyl ester carboxylesterase
MRREHNPSIWFEAGGAGEPNWLLLHGLGATGAVWKGVCRLIEADAGGAWIAPDLRGHGRSGAGALYGLGQHAADMAELLRGRRGPIVAVGHSMGGLVALGLATGWFGIEITCVMALGMKVTWTAAELEGARKRAEAPVRWLASRPEAVDRFLRVSGLNGVVAPDDLLTESGVISGVQGYRVASDTLAISIGAPPMDKLIQVARAGVALACGDKDGLVTVDELRALHPSAEALAGLSHNAHVEDPAAVWQWMQRARHTLGA